MISPSDISIAASHVLAQYDVSEAYLFGSFARGEQTPDSDIDLRLVCGNTMTFGTLYELSHELEKELGRKVDIVTNPPEHMRPPFRKSIEQERCASMKCCKQDEGLSNTSPQSILSKEPGPETLEAIREGDAFFATGESGRFDNGADLINAALKAPHSRPTNEWRLFIVRV